MGEQGHKQALAGEQPFSCAHQLAHETAGTGRGGSVAENGFHVHLGLLVHHGSGFGHGTFTRIQFDFHKLHLRAHDFEIDFVGCSPP